MNFLAYINELQNGIKEFCELKKFKEISERIALVQNETKDKFKALLMEWQNKNNKNELTLIQIKLHEMLRKISSFPIEGMKDKKDNLAFF